MLKTFLDPLAALLMIIIEHLEFLISYSHQSQLTFTLQVDNTEHPALYSRSILAENMHWISTSLSVNDGEIHNYQLRINHRYPLSKMHYFY